MTTGAVAAIRSKNVRQAAKSSSEAAEPTSMPSSARRAGSIQRRSSASGTCSAIVSPIFALVVASSSVSSSPARRRIISPSAQKVIPSPYAGERPSWNQTVSIEPVHVLVELPGQPGLADAGRPDDRDEPGAAFARRGVEEVLEQAELVVAADERRLERFRTVPASALGNDAYGTPGGHGARLALEGPARRPFRRRSPGTRRVRSPRRRGRCPVRPRPGGDRRC